MGRPGPFSCGDAGIGIYADDEKIALLLCAIEIADMADVEGVEATVGEDDSLPC